MSDDLRLRVAIKVDELADVLMEERDPKRREVLHSLAVDDLFDRMSAGTQDASALKRAFVDACRDFWTREKIEGYIEHSVKAPNRPHLRLVTPAEFDLLTKEPA